MPRIVEQFEARGLVRGQFKARTEPVAGVVIHTTGFAPWLAWSQEKEKYATPLDAAVHLYTKKMDYSGHVVVCGETGRVAQLAPFEVCALHVGSSGGFRYKWKNWPLLNSDVKWWRERWSPMDSPRRLMSGKAWSPTPNAVTIGVEVSPPFAGPRAQWSEACWASLAALSVRLARVFHIPKTPAHFVGHSDIHPLARSNKNAPWDPGPDQFDPTRDFGRLFPPTRTRYA